MVSRTSVVTSLPLNHVNKIRDVAGVHGVAHLTFFSSYFQRADQQVTAYATDVAEIFPLYPELRVSAADLRAMEVERTGVLLGARLAARYGWKVGDRVPLSSSSWIKTNGSSSWAFTVVGFFDDPHNPNNPLANVALLNYAYFDSARVAERSRVHRIIATTSGPTPIHVRDVAARIDRTFANSPDETRTSDEKTSIESRVRQIGDFGLLANGIILAALVALLLLTSNMLAQSARERTSEYGALKAIGFSNPFLVTLITLESSAVFITAAATGLLLAGLAFSSFASSLGMTSLPWPVVAQGLATAAVLAIAAVAIPAHRLSRLRVADALRES